MFRSLQVEVMKVRQPSGWVPLVPADEGLLRAVGVRCMKRLFDLIAGACAGLVLLLPIVLVALAVRLTSKGPPLYWSDRVGRNTSPAVATHLLSNPDSYLTPIGSFLRKSSLDELPQLWSILVGDMSFVGPRPALFNQHDLIELRTQQGVHALVPGLTGWAQVNGRDELPIPDKVKLDVDYLHSSRCCLIFAFCG